MTPFVKTPWQMEFTSLDLVRFRPLTATLVKTISELHMIKKSYNTDTLNAIPKALHSD